MKHMYLKSLISSLFLIFILNQANASNVDTICVSSKSMHRSIKNVIILPDSYVEQSDSFPVLYLLHGWTGDHSDWVRKVPAVKEYADLYQMIIICPDGGYSSWYLNSPIDDSTQYETYFTEELVPYIDKNYRSKNGKEYRAITGLSMGGFGAFYLAFKHQDIWGAAGSMSGSLDLVSNADRKYLDINKRLGDYSVHKNRWVINSVVNMTHMLNDSSLKIIFDCGTEDFLYKVNNAFHKKLISINIPHDYTERPGEHNWEYWANAVKYQFLFFREYFALNLCEPAENDK